jgi:hypothetical protein
MQGATFCIAKYASRPFHIFHLAIFPVPLTPRLLFLLMMLFIVFTDACRTQPSAGVFIT